MGKRLRIVKHFFAFLHCRVVAPVFEWLLK
jgi:hypothetical protein